MRLIYSKKNLFFLGWAREISFRNAKSESLKTGHVKETHLLYKKTKNIHDKLPLKSSI
jgi:hypothetical protein